MFGDLYKRMSDQTSARVPAPRASPEELDVEDSADPDTGEQWADACGGDFDENYYGETSLGDNFEENNQTSPDNADRESSSPRIHEADNDPVYLNLAAPTPTVSDSPSGRNMSSLSPAPPPLAPKPSIVQSTVTCSEQLPERQTPQPSQVAAPFSVPLPERGTPILFAAPDSSPLLVPSTSEANCPHVSPPPQLQNHLQSPPPTFFATDSSVRDRPQSEFDWLEIIEPTRQRRMYANLRTGECRWRLPTGLLPRTYAPTFLISIFSLSFFCLYFSLNYIFLKQLEDKSFYFF